MLVSGYVCVYMLSHVQLFWNPLTEALQAPLSMEFPRQEFWNGLPFPPPGNLPDPGIKPRSPTLQVDSLPCELLGKPQILLYIPCDSDGKESACNEGDRFNPWVEKIA